MDSSTIALFIRHINTALTVMAAIFAVCGLVICGLIIIFGKNSRLNAFRSKMFLPAFCVASLVAFAIEIVNFNYKHYLKYFTDSEFHSTDISPEDQEILLTSDRSVTAKINVVQRGSRVNIGVIFTNLDRRVTSVFVEPAFDGYEQLETRIKWTDEESTRELSKTLYKSLPYENYTAIQPCGKVSELSIIFLWPTSNNTIEVNIPDIIVNKQIPLYFSGLRLFVVSVLVFTIILLLYKPLRTKIAYYLFEYKFNPANRKQNFVYISLVIFMVCFSWFCTYTSSETNSIRIPPTNDQYNRYLVDAFIIGKTNLNFGHPEKLLNAERPYDWSWLASNDDKYKFGIDWSTDISYYKGKYYTYYGPVPAVLLFLPYKLITGKYLSLYAGVFVFTAITLVLMALLWRFLAKKYMPNARFAFYLLSFLTIFFVSRLSTAIRYPTVWIIVQVAGFTFTTAGIFLLLKSIDKEKTNHLMLFFACLCLALTVGCRPNMILLSILVPAVLWKRRSWKLAMFALIPYILVAIPLCVYNYVRFDSIFEFGQKYCTTVWNGTSLHLLNPLGKIHRMFITIIFYLFRPYKYSLHFPFVDLIPPKETVVSQLGFVLGHNSGGGLINFPILFCLFYLVKNIFSKDKPNGFYLSSIFFTIAAAMIVLYSMMGTFHGRYLLDCALFYILPSLFCAYYWCGDGLRGVDQSIPRLKIIYILFAISIFIGLFLFVSGSDHLGRGYYDPALYRYLEYSLGIIERS